MKPGSIGDPDIYFRAKISSVNVSDPRTKVVNTAWGITPRKYVHAATNNVEEFLAKRFNRRKPPKKHAKASLANGYRPELDFTPELDPR